MLLFLQLLLVLLVLSNSYQYTFNSFLKPKLNMIENTIYAPNHPNVFIHGISLTIDMFLNAKIFSLLTVIILIDFFLKVCTGAL